MDARHVGATDAARSESGDPPRLSSHQSLIDMPSPAQYTLEKLYDLNGLIALVSGGGTGIGLMIAQGLAANGARVYITGRRFDVLQNVAASWNDSKKDTMGAFIA